MAKFYTIIGEEINPRQDSLNLKLEGKDKIERITDSPAHTATSSYQRVKPKEESSLWRFFTTRLHRLTQPLFSQKNSLSLIKISLASWLISIITLMADLDAILGRGWRLEVVRRIALEEEKSIPDFSFSLLFQYLIKGFVLFLARRLYYLPMIIFLFISGLKFAKLAYKVGVFLWNNVFWGEGASWSEFFLYQVLPQTGFELLFQFFFQTLYLMLAWPIYRIIMIKYAVGEVEWNGFFSISEFRKAAGIFRRNAATVFSIYALMISLQVAPTIFYKIIDLSTFGFADKTFLPILLIFTWYWPIGYAYGILGRKLIAAGEITPRNASYTSLPGANSTLDEEYV